MTKKCFEKDHSESKDFGTPAFRSNRPNVNFRVHSPLCKELTSKGREPVHFPVHDVVNSASVGAIGPMGPP